ncbi:MAG: ABC transporter substrate-binding protein [Pseudomonadota bacterium]|nr:ABC transporter substrate-binding protein [Pseudomonadota bacterium]
MSAPPSPIVVGAIYPTAGAGADARHAIDTALEIVNGSHERMQVLMGEGGGLPRLNGAKLSITLADDGDDPVKAADAAEHLIVDGHATALIGGLSDATAASISRVAEHHGIPFLAVDSTMTNTGGLTWFFRVGRTPASDARSVLSMLGAIASANGRTLETVSLLAEDSPAGRERAAPVRVASEAVGLKLLDVPVPADHSAPDAIVPAVAAAAPDAVLVALDGAPVAPLLAQLAAREIGPLVLLQRGETTVPADGVFRSISFTTDPLPARPGVSIVNAAFKARSGKPLTTNTAREITGLLLLADVINRAASTKPVDLRIALMATDTPGGETLMMWDGIRFDDSGQNVLATPALQQVQHGAFQTVAPDTIAVAAPAWPARKEMPK